MRVPAFIVGAFLVAGCQPEASSPANPENALTPPPADIAQPQPDPPAPGDSVGNEVVQVDRPGFDQRQER